MIQIAEIAELDLSRYIITNKDIITCNSSMRNAWDAYDHRRIYSAVYQAIIDSNNGFRH